MKVKKIKYDKQGLHPKKVTVEMSMEEAAALSRLVGKLSYNKAVELLGEGATSRYHKHFSETYGCLTGEVFNRFYFDGLNSYEKGHAPGQES